MINVSTEFKNTMQYRRDFFYTCTITFSNGTSADLQADDFVVSGNGIVSGAGTSSFALGNAICKQLTLVIRNDYDQYYDYDFYNAVIQLYLNFTLSENTEIINLGKYTVREPETYGSTITLTAMDDMYKTDIPLSQTNFPKTVLQGLLDSCSKCGLSLLSTSFKNSDFVINKPAEGTTERQFIGMCAMIAGGNAVVDEYGRLKIITYDLSLFETLGNYDGGIFDGGTPYASGVNADGGNFYPWDNSDDIDGGTFKGQDKYHVFNKIQNCTISTDDVIITGVKISNNDNAYFYGTEGYVLELENQLVTGRETDALKAIGDLVIGLRFRPFSIDHICYPLAEIGDLCYIVDRKERVYQSVITDVDFSLRGFTVIKCSADSPQRNSSTYNSNAETRAIVNARNETQRQISEYDVAVQTLTGVMANSLGMFTTTEQTETGGVIVYQHNKPLLSESNIIWKKTENAFTVSTDGGETWNAGIDADGNVVFNVLSAIGILFDWARGGTLTLGGKDNINGELKVLDDDGNLIALINRQGVRLITKENNTFSTFELYNNRYGLEARECMLAFYMKYQNSESFGPVSNLQCADGNMIFLLDELSESLQLWDRKDDGSVKKIIVYRKNDTTFKFLKGTNFEFDASAQNSSTSISFNIDGADIYEMLNGATSGKEIAEERENAYSGKVSYVTRVGYSSTGLLQYYIKTMTIEKGLIKSISETEVPIFA